MSSSRKVLDKLISRTKIYLIIILILLIVLCALNTKFIVPSIVVYLVVLSYSYYANNKRKSEISEQLQDLTLSVDSAAKSSLINSPFPLVILETDGNIIWRSVKFTTEFANIDINTHLENLVVDIKDEIEKRENKKDKSIVRQEKIGKNEYKILGEFVKSKNAKRKHEYMIILYFLDVTESMKLQEEYENSKSCVAIITVDNYEETMQNIDSDKKIQIVAEIEKQIYEWTNDTDGILIKSDTERNSYIYIFEQKYLNKIKEDKFSLLDTIKEIYANDVTGQLTLSIAVSNDGDTDKEKYQTAQETMNIVLGRGGDQAAIRDNGNYLFYGGHVEEVEKRTKVKARVVAHALEDLIKESKDVYIMGHANPDIDAMGSALGIYRIVKNLDKNAYIITSTEGLTLHNFMQDISKQEEYKNAFIDKDTAVYDITKNSLVVIVDTHKKTMVEAPEILDLTDKIVIIDHHRRSADYIENSMLTFQEVYASSAAELVTELIQYVKIRPQLTTTEAESLYAGIMMDTKNFTFKTGVRTFEAAAYLRKCGVDIIRVKKWFQSDLESFNKIAEIVKNTEVIRDTIGIAVYDKKDKNASLMCAKAADELLTISDITASFVMAEMGDKVTISGRSIGDINVQVILEKLGGGGHITLAGAQIEGVTLEQAKTMLIEKINEYCDETIE
ncbi:MAG: DHH family phosphoesterase [Clostridia bacterium]|nr:DHH family phosphoesterase [Clostridia bacterium]